MIRNEKKTKDVVTDVSEYADCICYKSKLLNKYFDTYEELQEAEAEYNEAHAAELREKEEKKNKADAVKSAITFRLETELKAKEEKKEAYKKYLAECEAADKKVTEAKKAENDLLKEFCQEYGAFHDSVTLDDVTYNCDYSLTTNNWIDPFERFISHWF